MARILIADDERDVVDLVEFILAREGYEIIVASNGREAVERVETDHPDLVILDVMMPEMDGYAVQAHLMANEATRQIPIIFLTVVTRMREASVNLGKSAVLLQKPFDPKELLSVVQDLLIKR
jgi:CheY-like chemotaxis protein